MGFNTRGKYLGDFKRGGVITQDIDILLFVDQVVGLGILDVAGSIL